jgi:hypothetical protein
MSINNDKFNDLEAVLDDLKSALNKKKPQDIILSDDPEIDDNDNFVESNLDDVLPEDIENNNDDELDDEDNNDTGEEENNDLFNDTDTEELEEKPKFDRDAVIKILQILRENGFVDATFSKDDGFQWTYVVPYSFITLGFGDSYNPNKSFYMVLDNKLDIPEETLKNTEAVENILENFSKEYNFLSKILQEIRKVYSIVY